MTVSKRLRYEILRRDNHACRYCGQMAPDAPLIADVAQAALKWQQAIQLATELALRDREKLDPTVDDVIGYWLKAWAWLPHEGRPYPAPDGKSVVREWAARGLSAAEMRAFIDCTIGKWSRDRSLDTDDTWRYFAGCCWRRVTEIQDQARILIERGDV